jgi:hypothetical protein
MGGEGSMAGAQISLKNNKALRKVTSGKWKNYLGGNKKPTKKLGESSKESLKKLRTNLKKRNLKKLYFQILAVSIVISILIYILFML